MQQSKQDQNRNTSRTELMLGFAIFGLAVLIAFVWIPNDVASGAFEKVRRRVVIGDAFAPLMAAGMLALGGVLLVVENLKSRRSTRPDTSNVFYAIGLFGALLVFAQILWWTGPILVSLFGPENTEYRILRDTSPWKYSGFILAGSSLVAGLISFVERKIRWQSCLIGIAAALAMIAIYDLPFDNLLLPPNGDF